MNKLTTTFFAMVAAASATIPVCAETYTSASYVQREHLIAQWDGIDNAGTGTHDQNATEWKDLVGSRHLTLKAGGSWSAAGNALVVNGRSAEYNGAAPACKTIEVVFKMTRRDGIMMFYGGNQTTRQMVVFTSSGTKCYCEGLGSVNHSLAYSDFSSGRLRSVSGTFSTPGQVASAMYANGMQQTSNSTLQNSWGNTTQKIMIGIYPSGMYPWYGEVYSIRMYDCELTASEVSANYVIDKARFGEVPPAASPSYTSADYVQDGLVTQWDGIDNAGTGTHNPNATFWKDLAGNLDLTLTENGSWTNGNALSVNSAAAYGSTITPAYKTIEIVFTKPWQNNHSVVFHSGIKSRFVCADIQTIASTNSHRIYFDGEKSTRFFRKRATTNEVICAAALYDDSDTVTDLFGDGERRNDGSISDGWGLRTRVSVGGRFSDNSTQKENFPSQGEVYAIRLYSRRLTKAELAHNNIVDRKRFMTSASYTQDGLIGQWDGENNAGTGTHDPQATVWKDLKGNLDLQVIGAGSWNAAGNALVVSGPSAIGESPMPVFRTIELAFRQTHNVPDQHNPIMLNPSGDELQMIFFQGTGQGMVFSANAASGGPAHPAINFGQQYNSNAVRVVAATYTNVATAAACVYWDGNVMANYNVSDYWGINVRKMLIGLNAMDRAFMRSWFGELYSLRFYDRELTADELAADAAMDQKRIFAPRVIKWKNQSDGNFGTSGKWTVSGTGGQNIPRYSDHVFLTNGNYTVTLDEDWAIGELSVGAGTGLQFVLPSGAAATNATRLVAFGKVEADASARLVIDAAAFGKAYADGSVTLISCDVASPTSLQNLANNVSFVGDRRLGRVEVSADGKSLVYTAIPQGTMIIFK